MRLTDIITFFVFIGYTTQWMTNATSLCRPDIEKNSPFRHCKCDTLEEEKAVTIRCSGQRWTQLPNVTVIFDLNEGRSSIASFSSTDGSLTSLGQDVFKGESIHILELSNNAIDSINVNAFRGLESKLYQLNLNRNSLTTVPSWAFTYLYHLQHLHIQENQISELSASTFAETQLKNLRYLHLDGNKISVLAKDSLLSLPLQVLTISGNRISEIEPQSLPNSLWFIDIKNNILEDIPYLALKNLRKLKLLDMESNNISFFRPNLEVVFDEKEIDLLLSNNKVQSLGRGAFNSFTKFNRLDLSYNQIHSIDEKAFESVIALEELSLSYNSITHMPQYTFSGFAKTLKTLNLEENNLYEVPLALKPLTALEKLNMNSNKLSRISKNLFSNFKTNLKELLLAFNRLEAIPSDVLQGMQQLRHLDLSKNKIQRIDKMAFGSFEGSNGGTSLVKLNLAGNQIQEVVDPGAFLYMSQLAYLDLSFNKIKRLTRVSFERLEGLELLFLQNNDMIEFPRNALSSLNKLKYLLLDHNQILNLPNYAFQWLVHLERLSLSRNRIHTLNAKTFHSTSAIEVKSLNLAHNQISTMHTSAFENLNNLEQLLLNNNQLITLQPQIISSLKSLRHLTLAHNQINETQESAFANLPQLEKLSLAYNRLRTMKEGIFRRVPNLAQLDLSHNRIEALDLDFLEDSVHRLKLLDLSYNVIRKLDISQAKHSLVQLEIQHNQLEFIDSKMLQGFDSLISVDLSHNDLIEVNSGAFWKSPKLERLILSDNNLRIVWKETFADQTHIKLLDLSNNVLNSLEAGIFGRENVVEINLSQNNFTEIPTKALESIQNSLSVLDLSRNSIRSLSKDSFQGLSNMTKLVLSFNRLEVLEEETFMHLHKLKYLDISNNPVTTWSPHVFLGLSPAIEKMNLANTGLFSLPKLNSKGLKALNISHNRIYELYLHDVDSLKKLQQLDLSDNNLLDLKASVFHRLQNLRHLNLSGNGIRILQPEHFKFLDQLETLHLGQMDSLVRIPEARIFSQLRQLKKFYIYDLPQTVNYNISEILAYLPPLKTLQLESKDEKVTSVLLAKADLRLLRKLTISGKKVIEIEASAFERLRGYRIDLAIENTQIKYFSSAIFQSMSSISFLNLDLKNNRLQSLNLFEKSNPPMLNQHGTILESIALQGNPLVCDCRLEWLGHLIDYHSVDNSVQWATARKLLEEAKCYNPDLARRNALLGRKLTDGEQSLLDVYNLSPFRQKIISSSHIYGNSAGGVIRVHHFGKGGSTMVCDATGRLVSGTQQSVIIQFLNVGAVLFWATLLKLLMRVY